MRNAQICQLFSQQSCILYVMQLKWQAFEMKAKRSPLLPDSVWGVLFNIFGEKSPLFIREINYDSSSGQDMSSLSVDGRKTHRWCAVRLKQKLSVLGCLGSGSPVLRCWEDVTIFTPNSHCENSREFIQRNYRRHVIKGKFDGMI